jgi:hypothetical protein
MKSFYATLLAAACALHDGAAFSSLPQPPSHPLSSTPPGGRHSPLHAATISSSSVGPGRGETPNSPRITTDHEREEMETIRRELIDKYVSLGHSEEYAAGEVAYFLEDPERSEQYVEMRRVAMARGNDLGIEDFVQFAAAFAVGMTASFFLNYWHALQAANPDGLPYWS